MLQLSRFQILQTMLVTSAFCLHLFTFYSLSYLWGANMVIFESSVYGTYFIIEIGYLIAVLSGASFTSPLEAMTKINGAVLFNVLGVISLTSYLEAIKSKAQDLEFILAICKGAAAISISATYYYEIFRA